MAKHLTLEDIEEAIRVKRASIQGSDIRLCLGDYGFSMQPRSGANSSHERWVHPSGALVGLINPDHKDSVNFDSLEHVRDAIKKAQAWEAAQKVKLYALPEWIDSDALRRSNLTLRQSKEFPSIAILEDIFYPECARALSLDGLDKGRFFSVKRGLEEEANAYRLMLDQLSVNYGIRHTITDEAAQLEDGTGNRYALPGLQIDPEDIQVSNEKLVSNRMHTLAQIEAAQPQKDDSKTQQSLMKARAILAEIPCQFERVEGMEVALLPENMAKRMRHKRFVIPKEPTDEMAATLLQEANRCVNVRREIRQLQQEKFAEIENIHRGAVEFKDDAFHVSAKGRDGIFSRDAAGCVDYQALRSWEHGLRDWGQRVVSDESPLRVAGRSL